MALRILLFSFYQLATLQHTPPVLQSGPPSHNMAQVASDCSPSHSKAQAVAGASFQCTLVLQWLQG